MNKILKNIMGIILFLIIIILGASIIRDILILIFKDSLNKNLFFLIQIILIYTMIYLLSKTKTMRNLEESIIGKKFNKKKLLKNE